MIFAEVSATSEWVMSLSTLGCFVTSLVVMIAVLAKKSEKREVSFSPELVTRREYDEAKAARDAQLKEIIQEVRANRLDSDRQQSSRSKAMYEKMDEVRRELKSDIDGMRHDVNEQVNNLLTAVGELSGKIQS